MACNGLFGNEERTLLILAEAGATPDAPPPVSYTTPKDGSGVIPQDDDAGDSGPNELGPVGCLGDAGCERVVFATKAKFTGAGVGGITGADAKCQAAAAGSTLARIKNHKFRAWLSTDKEQPVDRLVKGNQRYLAMNASEPVMIASNWNDLIANKPQREITDENGVGSQAGAWTGTANDGRRADERCSEWTSNSGTGLTGEPHQRAAWTADRPADKCGDSFRLICFEE